MRFDHSILFDIAEVFLSIFRLPYIVINNYVSDNDITSSPSKGQIWVFESGIMEYPLKYSEFSVPPLRTLIAAENLFLYRSFIS